MRTSSNGSWIEKAANAPDTEFYKVAIGGMNVITNKIVAVINEMPAADLPIVIASLHHIEGAMRSTMPDQAVEVADDLISTVVSVSRVIKVPKRED